MRVHRLAIALAVALTACAKDAPREPEERRNLAALRTVPVPAGATVVRTETNGGHAPDTSEGPIVGWTTTRELRLNGELKAARIVARARRDMRRAGWRIVGGADFYLNARRAGSCLHLLTSAEAPSARQEIPEFTATDRAPPESEIARGLVLAVSDC